MDSSEDECNMNQNSTVDCTKDFADEPELALRGREGVRGGFGVARGLSIAGSVRVLLLLTVHIQPPPFKYISFIMDRSGSLFCIFNRQF